MSVNPFLKRRSRFKNLVPNNINLSPAADTALVVAKIEVISVPTSSIGSTALETCCIILENTTPAIRFKIVEVLTFNYIDIRTTPTLKCAISRVGLVHIGGTGASGWSDQVIKSPIGI